MKPKSEAPSFLVAADPILDRPDLHRFSHEAMASVIEIFILHEDGTYAGQAAWEAFRVADRLESELSRYVPNSDVGRINRLRPGESIRVGADAFECLKRCRELSDLTGGAFDATAGFLKDFWLGREAPSRNPSKVRAASVSGRTGMRGIELDGESLDVRAARRTTVDLGAFGKGYAVDRMAETLREWGIALALVHAGRSSVFAFGRPSPASGWPVTISLPCGRRKTIRRFELNGRAMGASGVGKGPHIIDPRTGEPARGRLAAWAFAQDAATADALSTAFMVMEPDEVRAFCSAHPEIQALVLLKEGTGGKIRLMSFGTACDAIQETA
jgi:thiamine biosynthesis lipoprotein